MLYIVVRSQEQQMSVMGHGFSVTTSSTLTVLQWQNCVGSMSCFLLQERLSRHGRQIGDDGGCQYSQLGCTILSRHNGALSCRHLKTNRHTLYSMHCGIGSKCRSSCITGIIWLYFLFCIIIFLVALRTDCRANRCTAAAWIKRRCNSRCDWWWMHLLIMS